MKIFKNIFEITEDNIEFLCYLRDNPRFKINEISEKFNLDYTLLANRIRDWVKQKYILKYKLPPKLGGSKYEYKLSSKAIEILQTLKDRI